MGGVFEQQAFQNCTGHVLLFGVELTDGLELQTQIIVGSAFAVFKQKPVGGDAETLGDFFECIGTGLGGARLVALDLLDVDAGGFGKALLRQTTFTAQGNGALGKTHGEQVSWKERDLHGTNRVHKCFLASYFNGTIKIHFESLRV